MRRYKSSLARVAFSILLVGALAVPRSNAASTEKSLYSFGNLTDGYDPFARPIFMNGRLYGTTTLGGAYDCGIVYELEQTKSGWVKRTLYTFTGKDDGKNPWAELTKDSAGNLYGTAGYGGSSGDGVVFELLRDSSGGWAEKLLHSFGGDDGVAPLGGLVFDSEGNLYGTTFTGGNLSQCDGYGCGTVFRLSPSNGQWTLTTLHNFDGNDGVYPRSTLYRDSKGNYYGTTLGGGSTGYGVVYRVSPSSGGGWTFASLYNAPHGDPGFGPVVMDKKGNIYGTNSGGEDLGYVYELTRSGKSWKAKVIYTFAGGSDGKYPFAGVVLSPRGELYGTTLFGGVSGAGTVFRLVRSGDTWNESVLFSFDGADGYQPHSGLTWHKSDSLIGTTAGGGGGSCPLSGCGVVFEITP